MGRAANGKTACVNSVKMCYMLYCSTVFPNAWRRVLVFLVEPFVSTSSCTNAFRFVDYYFFFDTPALEAKIQGDRGVLAGEAVD